MYGVKTKSTVSKINKIAREYRCMFDRVHIDFLGPVSGKMFFVLIDTHSKWPKVGEMSKMDTK